MAQAASLSELNAALQTINKDDTAAVIHHLELMAEAARGKTFASTVRKHGASVLKLAGTVHFKEAFRDFLVQMDDLFFGISMELAQQANRLKAVTSVLSSCAEAHGVGNYMDALLKHPESRVA